MSTCVGVGVFDAHEYEDCSFYLQKKWDKSGSHQLKMSRIRWRVKQQAAPSAIGDRNGMGFQAPAKVTLITCN